MRPFSWKEPENGKNPSGKNFADSILQRPRLPQSGEKNALVSNFQSCQNFKGKKDFNFKHCCKNVLNFKVYFTIFMLLKHVSNKKRSWTRVCHDIWSRFTVFYNFWTLKFEVELNQRRRVREALNNGNRRRSLSFNKRFQQKPLKS